jgi:hypothetical protein
MGHDIDPPGASHAQASWRQLMAEAEQKHHRGSQLYKVLVFRPALPLGSLRDLVNGVGYPVRPPAPQCTPRSAGERKLWACGSSHRTLRSMGDCAGTAAAEATAAEAQHWRSAGLHYTAGRC